MIWWYLIIVFVVGCTIEVHTTQKDKPVKHTRHRGHSTAVHSKASSLATPTPTPIPSPDPDWTKKYDTMVPPKPRYE